MKERERGGPIEHLQFYLSRILELLQTAREENGEMRLKRSYLRAILAYLGAVEEELKTGAIDPALKAEFENKINEIKQVFARPNRIPNPALRPKRQPPDPEFE